MSSLEIMKQMEYSIIGAAVNLTTCYQTHLIFRVACEHRLDLYLRTLGRKPPYYGYSTREHARAAWQNFLQSGAIQMASRMPSSQPTTPQRNRQMNLQSPAHSRPSPHSLHNLPTTSQHGANPSSTRSPPPPQYSVVPPLSQPHMLITRQDADTSL
jgi:hypothetical protein